MNPELKFAKELRNGNEEALFSLMTLYYNDLFKYGLRFTAEPNLTKDLIQEFFLHIWDNREKFKLVDHVKAYVVVSFKRFLLQELRKLSRQVGIECPPVDDLEYPFEDYIVIFQENEILRKTLSNAIESLSKREKELVRLRYYEQMTYEEIADKTSLTVRTIYNCLYEAIKKLRKHELVLSLRKNHYC